MKQRKTPCSYYDLFSGFFPNALLFHTFIFYSQNDNMTLIVRNWYSCVCVCRAECEGFQVKDNTDQDQA